MFVLISCLKFTSVTFPLQKFVLYGINHHSEVGKHIYQLAEAYNYYNILAVAGDSFRPR